MNVNSLLFLNVSDAGVDDPRLVINIECSVRSASLVTLDDVCIAAVTATLTVSCPGLSTLDNRTSGEENTAE